jgi:dephospho-CoA kinase
LIGLTGGIATGKSTATRYFAAADVPVIDADFLARRVVEPGRPALQEIRQEYGEGVIRPDGSLDRDALAAQVFRDSRARARLNEIVHPRVEKEAQREIEKILDANPEALVVYDVPLLFEVGMAARFDLVALVYVPQPEQKRRLMLRDGLSCDQAQARIDSQMDIAEKARLADVVLDNQGSVETLRLQIESLTERIRARNRSV